LQGRTSNPTSPVQGWAWSPALPLGTQLGAHAGLVALLGEPVGPCHRLTRGAHVGRHLQVITFVCAVLLRRAIDHFYRRPSLPTPRLPPQHASLVRRDTISTARSDETLGREHVDHAATHLRVLHSGDGADGDKIGTLDDPTRHQDALPGVSRPAVAVGHR